MLLEELTAEARNAGHHGLEALPDGAARLLGLIETGANEITAAYRHASGAATGQVGSPLAELFDGTARTTEALWRAADALACPTTDCSWCWSPTRRPGRRPNSATGSPPTASPSAWSHTAGLLAGLVSVRDQRTLERLLTVLQRQATLRYGVSPAFTSLAECPTGLRLARLALAAADTAGPRVVRFDDGPLAGLVADSPDVAARMARSVLGALLDLPAEQRTVLIGTLTAWYAASGSTEKAARALHCHANTVRQRYAGSTHSPDAPSPTRSAQPSCTPHPVAPDPAAIGSALTGATAGAIHAAGERRVDPQAGWAVSPDAYVAPGSCPGGRRAVAPGGDELHAAAVRPDRVPGQPVVPDAEADECRCLAGGRPGVGWSATGFTGSPVTSANDAAAIGTVTSRGRCGTAFLGLPRVVVGATASPRTTPP